MVPALCMSLGACSSVGTVNGINLGEGRMGVTENADQPFCNQTQQNMTMCLLAGIAIVGGLIALGVASGGGGGGGGPAPPPEA